MAKIKKIIGLFLSSVLIISMCYVVAEPAIVDAVTDSATVTATVTEEISITQPDNATMSATIPGMTGNPGAPVTSSLTWTVKTANAAGFNMKIKASQASAMFQDGTYLFTDYTPAVTGTPDYSWASPASAAAEFGFTVEPATDADAVAAFLDNGSNACNVGSTQTDEKCWFGLNGTTDVDMINRSTNTTSSGEAEIVKFQAESNAKFLKEGAYVATITVTATMN